ncbi:MAG: antitoxin [Deltaproteobacteria bacterium]|nr:antitoxin [Deltaproteobacteria bacterium]
MRKINPEKIKLDKEELALQKNYEEGNWKSVKNLKAEVRRYAQYAKAQTRKDKNVNIRMASMDIEAIRVKAFEEGIPYQTLMSSVLHKFALGRLVERKM